jgi:hypothetical protein
MPWNVSTPLESPLMNPKQFAAPSKHIFFVATMLTWPATVVSPSRSTRNTDDPSNLVLTFKSKSFTSSVSNGANVNGATVVDAVAADMLE